MATGLSPADLDKPQVGIASVWYEGNPCNMHLNGLADRVKEGVTAARSVGMRFNTIGVSDGISMGTSGMSYSLQSRDLIADSIETLVGAQWYDGLVTIPGCDKNMPGCVMAMARLNRPSLMVYGGSIRAGCATIRGTEEKLDVISAFQTYGQKLAGTITEDERVTILRKACPARRVRRDVHRQHDVVVHRSSGSRSPTPPPPRLAGKGSTSASAPGAPCSGCWSSTSSRARIVTRQSFVNAMRITIVLGGSTNAVLHSIAMARAFGLDLTIDDWQARQRRDAAAGRLQAERQVRDGRFAQLRRHARRDPDDDRRRDDRRLADDRHGQAACRERQRATAAHEGPADRPRGSTIRSRRTATSASSAARSPTGRVAKITGKEGTKFTGPARVFDAEEDMLRGLEEKRINKGDVVVIRYEGPKGGPGMPEMLTPTSRWPAAGMLNDVALITDGQLSGGSHGFIIGHVTPEAFDGGPIALVRDGDGHDRRREKPNRRVGRRPGVGAPPAVVEATRPEGDPRHAPQVHQEREERVRGVRDGRVT